MSKKLLLNSRQREAVRLKTFEGSQIALDLSIKDLMREEYKTKGFLSMKRVQFEFIRYLNYRLLGLELNKNLFVRTYDFIKQRFT